MMARYIDADELQARLERKKAGIANQRYTEGWNDCMMRVKSMVSQAPSADVAQVVRGEELPDDYGDPDDSPTFRFCHNCGAKMDGDDGDNE